MNQLPTPIQTWSVQTAADSGNADLDQLLQDYMSLNADAIELLAALYEAAETGAGVPPQTARFVPRLGAWEDRLFHVLDRLATAAEQLPDERMFAVA